MHFSPLDALEFVVSFEDENFQRTRFVGRDISIPQGGTIDSLLRRCPARKLALVVRLLRFSFFFMPETDGRASPRDH